MAMEADPPDEDPRMDPRLDDDLIKFDEINTWSEVKLDIIEKYASAYMTILSKQRLVPFYVDGFSGAGEHITRHSREFVDGSPVNALNVEPRFSKYFFIDLNGNKLAYLNRLIPDDQRESVEVIQGDCNDVLLERIFPDIDRRWSRRSLCVLDPYGVHLDWKVIETAGKMGTVDIFLNFPIMGMNRNHFWHNQDNVSPRAIETITRFWGDDSWRDAVYETSPGLFGDMIAKRKNEDVVKAFQKRLKDIAGFKYVPDPMPMCNSVNSPVYYLFFASRYAVAGKIIRDIFHSHGNKGR